MYKCPTVVYPAFVNTARVFLPMPWMSPIGLFIVNSCTSAIFARYQPQCVIALRNGRYSVIKSVKYWLVFSAEQ